MPYDQARIEKDKMVCFIRAAFKPERWPKLLATHESSIICDRYEGRYQARNDNFDNKWLGEHRSTNLRN
jgi:hypothetical protein